MTKYCFFPEIINIYVCVCVCVWSYAIHGAQCGVTTSHSTSGYFVYDTILASDCLLCQILPCPCCVWKIHGVGDTIQPDLFLTVIWVARLSSNSKNRENPLFNNNKKSFLLKHVCETINNKQTMFAFLANRRKNIERGRVTMRCG